MSVLVSVLRGGLGRLSLFGLGLGSISGFILSRGRSNPISYVWDRVLVCQIFEVF